MTFGFQLPVSSFQLKTRNPEPRSTTCRLPPAACRLFPIRVLAAVVALFLFTPYPIPHTLAFSLAPPEQFETFDMPGDGGGSVGLSWQAAPFDGPTVRYQVYIADQAQGPFTRVAEFAADTHYKSDVDRPWWSWDRSKAYHFYQVKSTQDLRIEDGRLYFFMVAVATGYRRLRGRFSRQSRRRICSTWQRRTTSC